MSITLPSRESSGQCALPFRPRPGIAGEAVSLLAQAGRGLAQAERETEPGARFASAYLAALRAAAAVLVARGHPHRARRRPQSVWVLLETTAPELAEWAAYFAAHSETHAAAQAGRTSRVAAVDAEELAAQAGRFLVLVRESVEGKRAA